MPIALIHKRPLVSKEDILRLSSAILQVSRINIMKLTLSNLLGVTEASGKGL
jgi:hypothetical protein